MQLRRVLETIWALEKALAPYEMIERLGLEKREMLGLLSACFDE